MSHQKSRANGPSRKDQDKNFISGEHLDNFLKEVGRISDDLTKAIRKILETKKECKLHKKWLNNILDELPVAQIAERLKVEKAFKAAANDQHPTFSPRPGWVTNEPPHKRDWQKSTNDWQRNR